MDAEADLITAATLAGLEPAAAARLTAELETIDVLVSEDDRVGFRHPILRSALYESIPAPQRGLEHARAARLLADRRSLEAAAAQLLHAPADADQWVVDALRRAGREAIDAGAPHTAVVYLQRALAEPPAPSSRPQLLRELWLAEAGINSPHAT